MPPVSRVQPNIYRAKALQTLTEINLDDLIKALGFERLPRALLRPVLRGKARRLAEQVLTCDELVGAIGLQAGSAWLLGQFVRRAETSGQHHVPPTGPLLITTNHPGLYDTVALFAAIPRPDLRIIAADRPFLRALPHVSRHLIAIDEATNERATVVRAATRHMRAGGAVLLFPGGKIEPDPASMPGAIAALRGWSDSVELFGRLVPELVIVPAVVSGVLSRTALDHPLARLRRARAKRELLAAALQIVFPALHTLPVRVEIGPPIRRAAFVRNGATALGPAVLAATARLMERARRDGGRWTVDGEKYYHPSSTVHRHTP